MARRAGYCPLQVVCVSLARDVRVFAHKTKQDTRAVIRASTLEISASIILRTPVDSGRARNGWYATLDTPSTKIPKKTKASKNINAPGPDSNSARAISRATAVISDFGGNVYYLTNNLPYIRRLEYEAWSTQAPAGMMRVSAAEYAAVLREKIAALP